MKISASRLSALLIVSLSLITTASLAGAEDERGRLPDGRAFRTDAEGNEIVDYIAELELNVESLTRQVRGLEDEVQEKRTQIAELQSVKTPPKLLEKDLVSARTAPPPAREESCDPQLKNLTQELEAARADLDVERGVSAQKLAAVEKELATTKTQLAASNREVETLQASASEADGRAQEALTVLTKARQDAEAARAELARQSEARTVVVSRAPSNERASLSSSRMRAVDSVRGNLNTSMKEVRSLVATRNDLYRRYSSAKRSVAFSPSKAQSNRGLNLDEIAKELSQATTIGQLSLLSKDLSDIRRKMQEDVGLMKRVGRF